MTIRPRPPPPEDPLEQVRRFQRTPATFDCLGMGCGTTLLVVIAAMLAVHLSGNGLSPWR